MREIEQNTVLTAYKRKKGAPPFSILAVHPEDYEATGAQFPAREFDFISDVLHMTNPLYPSEYDHMKTPLEEDDLILLSNVRLSKKLFFRVIRPWSVRIGRDSELSAELQLGTEYFEHDNAHLWRET